MTFRWQRAVRPLQLIMTVMTLGLLILLLGSAVTSTSDAWWGVGPLGLGLLAALLSGSAICAFFRPSAFLVAAITVLCLVDAAAITWAFVNDEAATLLHTAGVVNLLWLGALAVLVMTLVGMWRTRNLAGASLARATGIVMAGAVCAFIIAGLSEVKASGVEFLVCGGLLLSLHLWRPKGHPRWWRPQDTFSVSLVVLVMGILILIDASRGKPATLSLAFSLTGLALAAVALVLSGRHGGRLVLGLATLSVVAVIVAGGFPLVSGLDWLGYTARARLTSPDGHRVAVAMDYWSAPSKDGSAVAIVVQHDLLGGILTKGRVVDSLAEDVDNIPVHLRWVDDTSLLVNEKVLGVPVGDP